MWRRRGPPGLRQGYAGAWAGVEPVRGENDCRGDGHAALFEAKLLDGDSYVTGGEKA